MSQIKTFLSILLLSLGVSLSSQTLITHDFDDGKFDPYEVNKADQEARVTIVDGAVETHWKQELYNGTNSGRKAQIRPVNDIIFTQHIWMGFKLKVHSDYMKENTNTNAGLMQIWGYNGVSGAANHMCMLKFDGRNGGALVWQHRYNSVANKTHYLVQDNFPRDEFVDVIMHVQLRTKNTGTVQVWVNGELKIDVDNQTIGWGEMDETGMINGTYCFGTSIGQYNFFENAGYDDAYDGEDHWFDGHIKGETRTISYDNVALYNGADGYDLVNPDKSSTSCDKSVSHMEAECADEVSGAKIEEEDSDGIIDIGSIKDGYWTKYNGIDLSGMNSVYIQASTGTEGGTVELRSNGIYGDLIGEIKISNTNGWGNYESFSGNINRVTEESDLYFVFKGPEGWLYNIDYFGFSEDVICSANEEWIEAECYDEMSGVQTENSSEGTMNVGWINDGDWLMYSSIDLTEVNSIKARVSSKTSDNKIEIRLDSENGMLIGEMIVSNTGGNQIWVTDSVDVEAISGVRDVYLVFKGNEGYLLNINSFSFSKDRSVVTTIDSGLSSESVKVFPNPATNHIYIEAQKGTKARLYGSDGKAHRELIIGGEGIVQVNVEDLEKGLYFINIVHSDDSVVYSVLIE